MKWLLRAAAFACGIASAMVIGEDTVPFIEGVALLAAAFALEAAARRVG